jgi:N utilization substance protein B
MLRLGIYELLFNEDVPTLVAINEAVELAKEFGDKSSSQFVNGVLSGLAKSRDLL